MLQGQGGSGKTECLNLVRKVCEHFFGVDGRVYMASSNSAARQIQGDTVHSCLHMHKSQKMTPSALDIDLNAEGAQALVDKWAGVQVLVLDEVSMVSPRLLAALSYRLCAARERTCGADKLLYCDLGFAFGGIPLVILGGDFMQLPPFEGFQRVSLLKNPRNDDNGQEDKDAKDFGFPRRGYELFRDSVTDVVVQGGCGDERDGKCRKCVHHAPRTGQWRR